MRQTIDEGVTFGIALSRSLGRWQRLADLRLYEPLPPEAGIFGFFADSSFTTGDSVQGDTFLGFEVNAIHNLVHVASGLVLVAASVKRRSARTVAIAFGVVYGLVTIIGLIDGEDVLGVIPINGADNALHVALSALGIVSGAISRGDDRGPGTTVTGRPDDRRFARDERITTGTRR